MEYMRKMVNLHPYLKLMLRPFWKLFMKVNRLLQEILRKKTVTRFVSDKNIIYFDITSFSVAEVKTGIQRVVAKFLEYFNEIVGKDYEVIYISGLNDYHIVEKDSFLPREDLIFIPKEGDIYLSIDLNPVQPYEYWKTLNLWQQNGCKIIGCVYDLVYIKHPRYVADKNAVTLLSRWLKHATSNYDGLICISQTIENELLQWMCDNNIKNDKLKTGYFHLGGDFINMPPLVEDSNTAFFKQFCINNSLTFLAVATIEPRKGYIDLVKAFEKLAEEKINVQLVIVGRTGWKYQETVEKITSSKYYNKSIFWFSNCEDNVLEILYQIADCYISGSYYEGFGLGIIEASAKGLPVLLRDIPVNREVSENKGLYYENDIELMDIIKKVTKDISILHMQEKIDFLSWKESVSMAWNTIQKMV